jgi:hypothetical protein
VSGCDRTVSKAKSQAKIPWLASIRPIRQIKPGAPSSPAAQHQESAEDREAGEGGQARYQQGQIEGEIEGQEL